ncbi:hypothetical protein [Microbacterium sp. B24]|nr:hypothetical protein [Microbacterium sp. B24]
MTTTTPRPIAFADIREGDTIRATKTGSEHVVAYVLVQAVNP